MVAATMSKNNKTPALSDLATWVSLWTAVAVDCGMTASDEESFSSRSDRSAMVDGMVVQVVL